MKVAAAKEKKKKDGMEVGGMEKVQNLFGATDDEDGDDACVDVTG